MRSGVIPLAGWGLAVVAVALVGTVGFGLASLPTALLAGAGGLAVAVGLAALGQERRRPRTESADRPELLLESSVATTTLATGVAVALVGVVAVGQAVLGLGIGLVALGAGGVARELRAGRRRLREPEERG